ncbi:hypothetical protein [Leifsonia poae]|uniref:hypothetical protein n=1 Tax=Leifsonia poae TaxID=110933 RepID=UPI001CBB782B|nr:hypothetical protein [Leifsonia poae]
MTSWQASVSFVSATTFTEDAAFDTIDALTNHGAAMSVEHDLTGGTVVLSVEAATPLDAATEASRLVTTTAESTLGSINVTRLEVLSEAAVDAELERPLFPEVVGYAEIADMAGVSRQRARQFASINGFPSPVIETAQGPLMGRHAVERWLETRNTSGGRPRKAAV